jgi:hypothetical protein
MAWNDWRWSPRLAATALVRPSTTYRKAADFVHAHAEQYGPEMEVYLRKRAAEFSASLEEASGDHAL